MLHQRFVRSGNGLERVNLSIWKCTHVMCSGLPLISTYIENNFELGGRPQKPRHVMSMIKTDWLVSNLEVTVPEALNYLTQHLLHRPSFELVSPLSADARP